jgi:hypothetical protein
MSVVIPITGAVQGLRAIGAFGAPEALHYTSHAAGVQQVPGRRAHG